MVVDSAIGRRTGCPSFITPPLSIASPATTGQGFELKRRGELQIIKNFQSNVFQAFLQGDTLEECYAAVGAVADEWLSILFNRGEGVPDQELFHLITENKSMSKRLDEYGSMKSTSITTAKRLAVILGEEMVKDKGLAVSYIISSKPSGAPITERAIPVQIFHTEEATKRFYLRKWLKDQAMTDFDIRTLLDWDYYITRFGTTVQKIITIPAAHQALDNPVPRVPHPPWLLKRIRERDAKQQQASITDMFRRRVGAPVDHAAELIDIENIVPDAGSDARNRARGGRGVVSSVNKRGLKRRGRDGETLQLELETEGEAHGGNDGGSGGGGDPSDGISDVVRVDHGATRGDQMEKELDFYGWLAGQKEKWKRQATARKRRRIEGVISIGRSLSGYIRQATRSVTSNHWQILQIRPAGHPGEFKCWVIINQNIHSVTVRVPRVFYVNSRVRDEDPRGVPVAHKLPRGHPLAYLYEFSMDEAVFKAHAKELSSYFSHPDVEGVYELQVPLLFRAIAALGCVCTVRRGGKKKKRNRRRGGDDGGRVFDLGDLELQSAAEYPYLETANDFRRIFLFQATNEARGVVALFDTSNGSVRMWVLGLANSLPMPDLERLWTDMAPPEQAKAAIDFEIQRVRSVESAYKEVHRHLVRIRKTPTILVAMSPLDSASLASAIPATDEFPLIRIPSHGDDSTFAPFDWQNDVVARALDHYMQHFEWWDQFTNYARYAHFPIGNLPADHPVFVTDLFLARTLRAQQHVLWASPSPRPDLGGMERDDYSRVDRLVQPELVEPGAYYSICVEFHIASLAVDTLLQSARVNDVEGGNGYGLDFSAAGGGGGGPGGKGGETTNPNARTVHNIGAVDEVAACASALRVVKALVQQWSHDVGQTQNPFADMLQMHFFRWLQSSEAYFHDPALHRLIHNLMSKVFLQLVALIRTFQATVVYASFNKIIIATSKRSPEAAVAYVEYIRRQIAGRDLFHFLSVEPVRYWRTLFFMDLANYSGVPLNMDGSGVGLSPASQVSSQGSHDGRGGDPKLDIVLHWEIGDYLPPHLQQPFEFLVSEFMERLVSEMLREAAGASQSGGMRNLTANRTTANFRAFARSLLHGDFGQKLYQTVNNIVLSAGSDDDPSMAFPSLPGSYLSLTNAGLEFIKHICAVLALDTHLAQDVTVLKRNLLRQVGVGEFVAAAQFQNPCLTFVLPNVICSYCNVCRHLDLCRDPELRAGQWLCPNCQHTIDRAEVESLLVEALHTRVTAFQLQDLKCVGCGQIKGSHMGEYCECSGRFECLMTATDLARDVRVLSSIGAYYGFEWLVDEAEACAGVA